MPLAKKNTEQTYTYGDYAQWPDDERWELIEGVPYAMTAPLRIHQIISAELEWQIKTFLKNNKYD